MSLFRVVRGELRFDEEYILMYPEFKAIYNSNDSTQTLKIFKYIYEIADARSYSNKRNLSAINAHNHACDICNLPREFKVTKVLNKAIAKYKKLNYYLHADTLKELKSSLDRCKKINNGIADVINKLLDSDELTPEDISSAISMETQLFKLIDTLPDKINKIKELESTVYDELERRKELGRGGIEIPSSADGDSEIDG